MQFSPQGRRRTHLSRRRRGFSTAIMLASAFVLLGLMALALDMAMVTLTAEQIQGGVNAAALAGAADNFDRRLLCSAYVDLDLAVDDLPPNPTEADLAVYESESIRARALEFIALNEAQGEALSLEDNPDNEPNGDIVILLIDDPTAATPEVAPWPLAGHADGVQVTVPRTTARGNSLELWIAKSLGVTTVDISPSARAAFDQRIYGFQPLGHISIPALPILTDPTAWPSPETNLCLEADADNDKFAVSPATGAVAAGADGFPEFTVIIRQSQTAGSAHLIPFRTDATTTEAFFNQVLLQTNVGLYVDDLVDAELGGVVALAADNSPLNLNRLAPAPDSTLLTNLRTELLAIKGQERIWPLGAVTNAPENTSISDFAAGRVVDVSIDDAGTMEQDDDSLLVRVQPCLLQTSTALVRAGKAPNKWLGKVMLIR